MGKGYGYTGCKTEGGAIKGGGGPSTVGGGGIGGGGTGMPVGWPEGGIQPGGGMGMVPFDRRTGKGGREGGMEGGLEESGMGKRKGGIGRLELAGRTRGGGLEGWPRTLPWREARGGG